MTRCKVRPGYSLRTFAKQLAMDPTALSKLLSGKRPLTNKMIKKVGQRLGMSPMEIAAFAETDDQEQSGQDYLQLAQDTFEAIANWYYLAILELTYLPHFEPDSKWIARTLGISQSESAYACETLFRLGLLHKNADGKWEDRFSYFTTIMDGHTDATRRELQKQILRKAMDSLDTVSIERRSQTGMTFAANANKLTEAKVRIQEFMRELTETLQKDSEPTDVYQLTVSLFPLTHTSAQKED
jgi:uncharacterized protein (TIGR02147 family)